MRDVAMSLENEHPSHSLILDIADSCWNEVFSPNEMDEIRGFQRVRMPNLSDAGNRNRFVSDVRRQYSGRKMNYLFMMKKKDYEVGCDECALAGSVRTTKELYDASFKMPKVMKDMANSIFSSYPALSHNVTAAGYYIGDFNPIVKS
ncbi:hypothetical protein MAM1_0029d02306 [Mucor ambiguus]|uniref:Uncharacterized protein n=1 Tax=Mucor ambiguus TaxID=91626 RepID=A0A0C9MLW8_9FUNG|nr:hypothetical protein MAM1_0029d02306 [Mucor ambiguus]